MEVIVHPLYYSEVARLRAEELRWETRSRRHLRGHQPRLGYPTLVLLTRRALRVRHTRSGVGRHLLDHLGLAFIRVGMRIVDPVDEVRRAQQ